MTELVAIIGAGPYGLSVAAHLRARDIPFRIFGEPMRMWRSHMPQGMVLKSDGFASNLSAPGAGYTLAQFCRENNEPYGDIGHRTPLATLLAYGLAFQRRQVGAVEAAQVTGVRSAPGGFEVTLDSGEALGARHVVVATGLLAFRRLPETIAALPRTVVSHCSAHHDLSAFKGRRVIVLGGGQSAFETAALANEAGAEVTLLSRRPVLWFDPEHEGVPSAWRRFRHPNFGLGPGWRAWFWSESPTGFYYLPRRTRHAHAYTTFGPAGSGWLKHRVHGVIPHHVGPVRQVATAGSEVILTVETASGKQSLVADHVIAATGYRADIGKLDFLAPVQSAIAQHDGIPVLNRRFETSLPGLHMVGYVSAGSLGPSMRFIYGTGFAAPQLARALHRPPTRRRAVAPAQQPA